MTEDLINVGNCFYCKQPVMAAEGQSIKWLKRTGRAFGKVVSEKQCPTHKACRMLNNNET